VTAIKSVVTRLLALALIVLSALVLLTAFPGLFFPHSHTIEQLTFKSDHAFDHNQSQVIGSEILRRLEKSPLGLASNSYVIYIANESWRRKLFWNVIAPPTAFGFAAYPLTNNHVFLSGANFDTNRLISPNGIPISEYRTLVYYGAHELAHVRTGELLGTIDHLRLPAWIMEGLADYCAFEPLAAPEIVYRDIAKLESGPELWNAHSYYAKYRLAVQYYLEVKGWSLPQLLASNSTFDEAWHEVSKAYE